MDVTAAASFFSSFLPSYPAVAWIVVLVIISLVFTDLWGHHLHARLRPNYIPGVEAGHLLSSDGANIPVIHAFLICKGRVTATDMANVLIKAGIPHKRFQRLKHCVSAEPNHLKPFDQQRGDWPVYWYPEPGFRPEKHIRNLPDGLSQAEVKDSLGGMVNTPPSFSLSPWEILVANALDGNEERTALILRLHHVLGDGLSVLGLLEAISEPVRGEGVGEEEEEGGKEGGRESMLAAVLKVGVKYQQHHHHHHHHHHHKQQHHHPSIHLNNSNEVTDPTAPPRAPPPPAPSHPLSFLSRLLHSLLFYLRMSIELPVVVHREFLAPPPEQNLFKPRPLTGQKTIAWRVGCVDVARVKRVKDALGVKLNDVLLACATGALRTVMLGEGESGGGRKEGRTMRVFPNEKREEEKEEQQQYATLTTSPSSTSSSTSSSLPSSPSLPPSIRFFAPMSTRTNLASLRDLDNQLSVLSIPLPTGLASRRHRLAHIHDFTMRLKHSTFPLGMAWLTQHAAFFLPVHLLEKQNNFLCERASGVLTNVPGPVHARQIAKAEVEEIMVFVPAVSSIGMTLSTFTYGRALSVGLVLDQAVPCSAEEVLDAFVREFEAYERMVLGEEEGGRKEKEE